MVYAPARHDPPLAERPPSPELDTAALLQALRQALLGLARGQLQGLAAGAARALSAHALVHEAIRQLGPVPVRSRSLPVPLLAQAGRAMRSVVLELLRHDHAAAASERPAPLTLVNDLGERLPDPCGEAQILQVDHAIDELQRLDARMARVLELRFFGGLTEGEVAAVLAVNERTVRRDWRQARDFLADRWR